MSTSEPWKDSNHPLFLHHSDQPGAILVSQQLVEDNFTTWQESMLMALTIKNKVGFVTGSLPRPTDNPTEELQWERCTVLVKTWLLGSMSKEISKSVIHFKDARGIWIELIERFSQSNIVSLFNVEKAIHDCTQGSDSVSTYFTKLKSLWDEKDALTGFLPCPCTTTDKIKVYFENQKTMQFLMGLNSDFEQVRSSIIGLDPFPAPNKAYSMVLRQEQQAKIPSKSLPPSDTSAFAIHGGKEDLNSSAFAIKRSKESLLPGASKSCDKCNMSNHSTRQCRSHLTCSFCNNKGHTVDYCRKKKRTIAAENAGSNINLADTGANDTNLALVNNHGNLSLSNAEYQQVMALLNRLQSPSSSQQQQPNRSIYNSTAHHVGNPSAFTHFSGPTHGEDDWDGV
ncbi:uncharacterized protein LOC126668060 [Mercurialis annua]|uniref:uncharacterized protein LOC126668060 n=1 Tax=Mercurialis annua TaxID=3986 RepID=UPI0021605885|nr:uncharacterized protein LOC126668060 [Mercurialis annua]